MSAILHALALLPVWECPVLSAVARVACALCVNLLLLLQIVTAVMYTLLSQLVLRRAGARSHDLVVAIGFAHPSCTSPSDPNSIPRPRNAERELSPFWKFGRPPLSCARRQSLPRGLEPYPGAPVGPDAARAASERSAESIGREQSIPLPHRSQHVTRTKDIQCPWYVLHDTTKVQKQSIRVELYRKPYGTNAGAGEAPREARNSEARNIS